MRDGRKDIEKVIEWFCMQSFDQYQTLPVNYVPLVVGPSGSGKTHTIKRTIEKYTDIINRDRPNKIPWYIPFIEIDATMLTAEGWEGLSLPNALGQAAVGLEDPSHIQSAVIFIDEIDKIAMSSDVRHSNHAKNIQQNFLKLLDPDVMYTVYSGSKRGGTSFDINLSQTLIIFGGAFESIFQQKLLTKKSIGFNADTVSEADLSILYDQELNWEDIKKFGFMEEFVNRMNVLIQTKPYSKYQLNHIARNSFDKSFIENELGVKVSCNSAVNNSINAKSGARGIQKDMYQQALGKYKLKGLI